jgi:outer membrane protein TolC
MRFPCFLLFLSVFCIAAGAWCQQPAQTDAARDARAEVLTLEGAIQQALENNRVLKIASLEVQKSEDTIAATRTRRLPNTSFNLLGSQLLTQVQFQFEQGQFGTFSGIGPVPAERTFITTPRRPNAYVVAQVAQPLSQLYKVTLGIRQGEFAREVARQRLRAQQQALIHNVKKLYFAALDTESALEATEEALKFYRELNRVVGGYLQEKVALKSESLDVKAQLAKEEYDALTLRHSLATRKEQLNQVLGRDIRTEFVLSPLAEPTWPETDLTAAQARALAQRPEIQEARLRLKQAEQDRRIKKSEYIPDISLSFNYLSPFRIEFVPKNIATVGLQFSWEPWDWGRRKHELDEKSRVVEQARQAVQDAEQQVLVDVNERYRKLAETRALIRVAEMTSESAREKVRLTQNRYAERAALLKDVLQAQSNLADASYNYRQAVVAFWTAKADFEKALGEGQ